MANTILNSTVILNEALAIFHNNLVFSKTVNRQYDDRFADGASLKPGTSLSVRKPVQHTVTTGATINVQDKEEESLTITCATQKHIAFQFSSADLKMKIDDFAERYLKTGMARLASQVDYDGLNTAMLGTWNSVGTPGTPPNSALMYLNGGQKLDEMCCPRDGQRYATINPAAQAATVNALTGLFHAGNKISSQYSTGEMYDALGFKFGMTQNVNSLTMGSRSGTILNDDLAGANNTEGSTTIHIDGLTGATDTIKAGEIFTVAGVYAVNPETKQSTGALFQFKVAADVIADSNEKDLTVQPMYTSASGTKQNITAFPADDAVVTFLGTASIAYPQNLLYHKDAITLVTADLDTPSGTEMAKRAVMDNISMRMISDYDIINDRFITRMDVYYGWTMLRPEWSCRLWG
jgi:hypothetical protein